MDLVNQGARPNERLHINDFNCFNSRGRKSLYFLAYGSFSRMNDQDFRSDAYSSNTSLVWIDWSWERIFRLHL